jgi:hypothetical protein
MATSCNDTDFAKIGTPEQDEAKDVHLVKAKILSIDRFLRTAEIQYITSCSGITQTTAVEFFYYCPYSDGGEDILVNGHWAFLPDDFVYVTKLGSKTYIVGHADIRETKPCAAEWWLLRLGTTGNCSPFYIFDIYTGKLYDKWPEITWPIYPNRIWDDPRSNGEYKIQEYRDWRLLYRNSVIPVHSGSAWDKVRWNSDLERYEETSQADEWDLYIHNQFRVGFSWKPGALQVKGYNGTSYGPTQNNNLGDTVYSLPCGEGNNRCQMDSQSGTLQEVKGVDQHATYDWTVSVDTYDYSLTGVPFYIPVHEVANLGSDGFGLVRVWRWDTEDRYDDYHYRHISDTSYDPTKHFYPISYERTFHVVASGSSIHKMGMWCYEMLDFTNLSGWTLYGACAFFIENENTVAHSNCFQVNFEVEVTERAHRGNATWGCCYGSSEMTLVEHESSCTVSFAVPCPWMQGPLLSGSLVNTYQSWGTAPQAVGYIPGGVYTDLTIGHPLFVYDTSDDFAYGKNDPYYNFHSLYGPVDLASICISHGTSGVWGIAIAGYWGTIRREMEGDVSGVHVKTWEFDFDDYNLEISMAHYPRHKYTDVAEVKLADLYEISPPTVIKEYIRTLMWERYLNDPVYQAWLPPPYGTQDPMNFDPLVLLPGTYGLVELFPVTIIDPPAP